MLLIVDDPVTALQAISKLGGNLADEPLTEPTGTRDAILALCATDEPSNRRLKIRWPIKLNLIWTLLAKGHPRGVGRTSNMSSSGVLFTHSEMPREVVGRQIELRIEWPFLLEGRIPLQLFAYGKVVRLDSNGCAVELEHTEFRTCKQARVGVQVLEATA